MHDLAHDPGGLVKEILEGERRDRSLSQKALAERLGLTDRTYRNWMNRPLRLTADQVGRLVSALELNEAARTTVYGLTGHVPPAEPAEPAPGPCRTSETAAYQRMLDGITHPSLMYDNAFDVVIMNTAFRDLFGRVRRHATASPLRNGTRYVLFHPDAPELLGGDPRSFRESWLMPALAHFLSALQQRPGDPGLRGIEEDIHRHPRVHRAYRETPRWIRRHGGIHIGGGPRPFWDPRSRTLTEVHLVTETHQGNRPSALRHATFVFAR